VVDPHVAAEFYIRRNYTKLSRHYRGLKGAAKLAVKKRS